MRDAPGVARWAAAGLLALSSLGGGCASHSESTKGARSALDAGRPALAVKRLNEQLGVADAEQDPGKLEDDKVLYLLDRAVVLQQLGQTELSSRDLQIADKRIEVLDFGHGTLDDIGKYVFSDDTGAYQAPAYEKLMINTINMMNYLQRRDLNGARVEARRFSVMRKFIMERAPEDDRKAVDALSAAGSYLAGFVFERSKQPGEALRYYDEALQAGQLPSLRDPVRRLSLEDPYRTPELTAAIGDTEKAPDLEALRADTSAEVLVIVNYGRVPAKIPKRIPIGLALTYAAVYMTPQQTARTNYLAGQGLVTWVNYPTLGKARGEYAVPNTSVDGRPLPLDGLLAVDQAVAHQWKQIEGKVIAAAITRMITRIVAGEAVRRASGEGTLGALLSLATQATMTAADTPDTRSWSTLPARVAVARVRVPPGTHELRVDVSGQGTVETLELPERGWAAIVLTVLR